MAIRVNVEKTLIYGCLHTPYQDEGAFKAMLDFISYWKPDTIIANGDNHDLYAVSRYPRDPMRSLGLQHEIEEGREANARIRTAAGRSADFLLHQGNHEYRWERYICNNVKEFTYVDDFQFESVFRLADSNIQYIRGNTGFGKSNIGPITIGHFPTLRKDSGATAKAIITDRMASSIANHSHRMGTFYKTTPSGVLVGHEGGCLCSMSPEYVDEPNWQHGFMLVQRIKDKDRYFITPIPVVGGNVLYDGRLF